MRKMSKERLMELIKDEKMASKEYKSYGYKNLSKNEHSHEQFLKRKLKQM